MASGFEPRLSILREQQRRLWPELKAIPNSFLLIGGTAISLQIGHRQSIDFDFLSSVSFDPDVLYGELSFLADSKQVQKSANTLTCLVNRDGPVKISFFGSSSLKPIECPLVAADIGIRIASLLDLSAMKVAVVQKRAEAKDYLDIDALIQLGGIELPTMLAAAAAVYGHSFNPELTLKSLCYFADGDLETLPSDARGRLLAAVREVDLDHLPVIERKTGTGRED